MVTAITDVSRCFRNCFGLLLSEAVKGQVGQLDIHCYIVVLLPYGAVPGCVWESRVEDTLKSSNFVWDVHEFEGIVVGLLVVQLLHSTQGIELF
ncbi:hypothetical protein CFP56_022576 [Quercus suber]|uniref:Uncharacterized protein n=1 Tax=Quercus suber TaxID=58331 RepID=A0AAW0LZ47_QUESU